MLRATIADDLAAGKTTDEIADDIAEHYAFSPERAAVIAATEVSRANSEAALESYQAAAAAGVPVRKRWLAEADCCDVCSGNAAAGPIDLDHHTAHQQDEDRQRGGQCQKRVTRWCRWTNSSLDADPPTLGPASAGRI